MFSVRCGQYAVKAALSLLYNVLGSTNPFAECLASQFAPEKTELRYHTASQLGQLLHELRKDRRSYFGHLTYHLAAALFFTGCRFHEWAGLTMDRLVREPGGVIIAARLQVKGGAFRDLPVTRELSDYSLDEWFASVKGMWVCGRAPDLARVRALLGEQKTQLLGRSCPQCATAKRRISEPHYEQENGNPGRANKAQGFEPR